MKALGKYLNGQIYIDADYRDSLSKEDQDWYSRFLSEYYLTFNLKDDNCIHNKSYHKQLYADNYSRKMDILNQGNIYLLTLEQLAGGDSNDDFS
jgi:hypothetical protein